MPYTCPIKRKTMCLKEDDLKINRNMSSELDSSSKIGSTRVRTNFKDDSDYTKNGEGRILISSNGEDDKSIPITSTDGSNIMETQTNLMPSIRSPLRRKDGPITRSKSQKKYTMNAGGISKLSLNLNEILKFPKESTHAYSYAYLSPNSLALRLSILKRSLEILLDRFDLMSDDQKELNDVLNNSTAFNIKIENLMQQMQTENGNNDPEGHLPITDTSSQVPHKHSNYNINSNASSTTPSVLFQNKPQQTSKNLFKSTSPDLRPQNDKPSKRHEINKSNDLGIKTLISLLKVDKLNNTSEKKILTENLHNLSLSLFKIQSANSESQLRSKLLYALATPFYESIVQTPIIMVNKGTSSLGLSSLENKDLNSPTLSSLNSSHPSFTNDDNNKPVKVFHLASQKNSSPQAVFTCELSDSWNLKAANDLACLIFGVSKTTLRRLTLLDLISPDSRAFVLNRLVASSLSKADMIFSGEIIAIARPGNKLTWASLWAKKKGDLIICMFDQVLCDSIDLVLNLENSKIESHKKVSGGTLFNETKNEDLKQILPHLQEIIDKNRETYENFTIPSSILNSQAINKQRYFTLKNSGISIPCAVTSKVIDESKSKLKLKIHSLPYIAGIFIISSADHKVLSFNQSVSKNLFGLNETQLLNESITKIIPNFIKIIEFVKRNFQNLKIIPGLVLPEHLFRHVDALINHGNEEAFLNSIGLDGLHADGSIIKVDVQARCSTVDTLVLWITYTRTDYGSKLDSKKQHVTFDNHNKYHEDKNPQSLEDNVFEDERELPSQLSILVEKDIQSVSRSSSLRSSSNTDSSSTSVSTVSDSISQRSSATDIKKLNDEEPTKSNTKPDKVNLDIYKMLDSTMDEARLLKIENETMQRQRSISSYYPKNIGLKRRKKTFKEFEVLKKMGQGAYGKVVLAENKKDRNYRIVIKLIIKERILVDTWVRDRKLGTIPSEIQIMSTLNSNPHPNIMRLIDFFEDDDYYYIETPQHGFPTPAIDLFDMIELKKSMTEEECKSIMKQCNSALNYLHNNGVVHRDIKDENLIIDSKGVIKLIDFGSAAYTKQGPFDVFVGTLDYAAPEVLNGQPYEGKPQDVWSLGILMYTLIYKENPFYNVDEIMEGELRIPFVTSDGCINLIKKILNKDIKKRPTMTDIVNDSWFF